MTPFRFHGFIAHSDHEDQKESVQRSDSIDDLTRKIKDAQQFFEKEERTEYMKSICQLVGITGFLTVTGHFTGAMLYSLLVSQCLNESEKVIANDRRQERIRELRAAQITRRFLQEKVEYFRRKGVDKITLDAWEKLLRAATTERDSIYASFYVDNVRQAFANLTRSRTHRR